MTKVTMCCLGKQKIKNVKCEQIYAFRMCDTNSSQTCNFEIEKGQNKETNTVTIL